MISFGKIRLLTKQVLMRGLRGPLNFATLCVAQVV